LTVKEPFRVTMQKIAGKTVLEVIGLGGSFVPAEEDEGGVDGETPDLPRIDARESVGIAEADTGVRLV
jgi:hypothetical protein